MKSIHFFFILYLCFFLFPITVNSQTTHGKIEFYQGESKVIINDEVEILFSSEEIKNDEELFEEGHGKIGQFGDKMESTLLVIGTILSMIAVYYLNQNRRISK